MVNLFINEFIKFFFLLTPFFLLSTFLSLTSEMTGSTRRKIALKSVFATAVICIILFFLGNQIFSVFGITLNSFRVGTGVLLFLSAVSLVQGQGKLQGSAQSEDIAVVPLAIPIAVGPATTGALLVMGGELSGFLNRVVALSAIVFAVLCTGILLLLSGYIEKIVRRQGLTIMSRITGLVLSALAAQMIMTGIKGFIVSP